MKKYIKTFIIIMLLSITSIVYAKTEVYFSPNGGIRDQIIKRINLTKTEIDIAIFDFTSGDIAQALIDAKDRGVKIRIIADKRQAGGKHTEIGLLQSKGFEVKIMSGKGRGIMHNKIGIFDKDYVITGSYNWSKNAEENNYENIVIFDKDEKEVIEKYVKEFDKLWSK